MKLSSPAFDNNTVIPNEYTIDGAKLSPPLVFADIPAGTVSLALIMDDPDVPRELRADGMFDHWVVWNIPADCRGAAKGQAPPGVVGANTAGPSAYYPPAPPHGRHHYSFRLYALDTKLSLADGSTKASLVAAMAGHILAEAELVGLFR